jgi:uncharacterized membrane protein
MKTSTVTETHPRTLVKTMIYRAILFMVAMIIATVYGGNPLQALTYGLSSLVIGMTVYYCYDRVWLLIGWHRDSQGSDSRVRSLIKAIFYRVVAIIAGSITAWVVFANTKSMALSVAVTQAVINVTVYYVLERIFDRVDWGKIK